PVRYFPRMLCCKFIELSYTFVSFLRKQEFWKTTHRFAWLLAGSASESCAQAGLRADECVRRGSTNNLDSRRSLH
ncbi:MAG: hypothetical protein QME74_11655, partial [Candidatus Edwardsbacteria bacterium]|nr:hypothetical protein [Candidatus Edwardsbacteria bacterium]